MYSYIVSGTQYTYHLSYHHVPVILNFRTNLPEYVFYNAQLIAHQDCVYRNMDSYKYIGLQDVDEILVPDIDRTIPELIRVVDKSSKLRDKLIGCYMFTRSFCTPYNPGVGPEAMYFSTRCVGATSKDSSYFSNHIVKKCHRIGLIAFALAI